jgi:2,5-diketo-D-gluconate reductase B
METIKLKSGEHIPVLGLGTWRLKGKTGKEAVKTALEIGYRMIDTAEFYGNHKEIAEAIKMSGVLRKDIFITTKVPPFKLGRNSVLNSVKQYCRELETDYLDLLLIHWPNPVISVEETLLAFDQLKNEGTIRAYGVSNFSEHKLMAAIKTKLEVDINQIEVHPSENPRQLIDFCFQNGVAVMAYSPIGKGKDIHLSKIYELAQKYNRSEAQVIINWIISKGMIAIPRSENPDHIRDNFGALNWKLDEKDVDQIDNISSAV